jgi:hypothetical protein
MLAVTDGDSRRAHIELPIELAEKLKAQIEAALVRARAIHIWFPGEWGLLPGMMEADQLPGDERG